EEIEWLNVAGVVITATLVHGDEQHRGSKKLLVGGEMVHDFLDHALEEVELRRGRMAVQQAVWLDERDSRERAVVDGREEVGCVLNMRGALCGVAHNGRGIGFEVADVAVGPADLHRRRRVAGIVLKGHSGVVSSAVIRQGNSFVVESIADSADIGWRYGAALSNPSGVNRAIRQKARTIVVDHIDVARLALRAWVVGKRLQVINNGFDSGL